MKMTGLSNIALYVGNTSYEQRISEKPSTPIVSCFWTRVAPGHLDARSNAIFTRSETGLKWRIGPIAIRQVEANQELVSECLGTGDNHASVQLAQLSCRRRRWQREYYSHAYR